MSEEMSNVTTPDWMNQGEFKEQKEKLVGEATAQTPGYKLTDDETAILMEKAEEAREGIIGEPEKITEEDIAPIRDELEAKAIGATPVMARVDSFGTPREISEANKAMNLAEGELTKTKILNDQARTELSNQMGIDAAIIASINDSLGSFEEGDIRKMDEARIDEILGDEIVGGVNDLVEQANLSPKQSLVNGKVQMNPRVKAIDFKRDFLSYLKSSMEFDEQSIDLEAELASIDKEYREGMDKIADELDLDEDDFLIHKQIAKYSALVDVDPQFTEDDIKRAKFMKNVVNPLKYVLTLDNVKTKITNKGGKAGAFKKYNKDREEVMYKFYNILERDRRSFLSPEKMIEFITEVVGENIACTSNSVSRMVYIIALMYRGGGSENIGSAQALFLYFFDKTLIDIVNGKLTDETTVTEFKRSIIKILNIVA